MEYDIPRWLPAALFASAGTAAGLVVGYVPAARAAFTEFLRGPISEKVLKFGTEAVVGVLRK